MQELKFDNNGLIPAIIQEDSTNEVLMLAYMNKEALEKTVETGKTHFWSRSRGKLWMKGETSKHYQFVEKISCDCDNDTLLIKVKQVSGACHTGHKSCFYRDIEKDEIVNDSEPIFDAEKVYNAAVLQEIYEVIIDRINNPKEGSYTNYLFKKGLDKMLKKIGEEASEVIIAAKNKDSDELRYEIADLTYHLLVVMVEQGLSLDDLYTELGNRR